MATLEEILIDSYANTDLLAEVPTGAELSTRVLFSKRAVREWEDAYKWRQLKAEYSPTYASLASLALPNFKYLDGVPVEVVGEGVYEQYPEINSTDRFNKSSDEKYCYIVGNDASGWAINFNGINLNATTIIPYIRHASMMATLTDVCEVPDAQFVTNRVISYVFQARNDERFSIVQGEGNRLLKNMVSREMIRLPGGTNGTPKKGIAAYSIGS